MVTSTTAARALGPRCGTFMVEEKLVEVATLSHDSDNASTGQGSIPSEHVDGNVSLLLREYAGLPSASRKSALPR